MAKLPLKSGDKSNEDEIIVPTEEESTTESTEETTEATQTQETVEKVVEAVSGVNYSVDSNGVSLVPRDEKKVSIVTNQNHSCTIGQVHYTFIRGKAQNVPMEVRRILWEAGLLAVNM